MSQPSSYNVVVTAGAPSSNPLGPAVVPPEGNPQPTSGTGSTTTGSTIATPEGPAPASDNATYVGIQVSLPSDDGTTTTEVSYLFRITFTASPVVTAPVNMASNGQGADAFITGIAPLGSGFLSARIASGTGLSTVPGAFSVSTSQRESVRLVHSGHTALGGFQYLDRRDESNDPVHSGRTRSRGLGDSNWIDSLAHQSVPAGRRHVLRRRAEGLGRSSGRDARRAGLGPPDRWIVGIARRRSVVRSGQRSSRCGSPGHQQ